MRTVMFRALAAMAGVLTLTHAAAQAPQRQGGQIPYLPFRPVDPTVGLPTPAAPPAAKPPSDLEKLKQQGQDLEALRAEQAKAMESEIKLRREIEAIGSDRRQLTQQLLDTAARIRALEEQVAAAEARLKPLALREQALRQSLEDRRGLMAEVLAALQRIGRHPPPALMVSPQDALQSLRSAMLLGAVLPVMRRDADRLIADLLELTRIREQIATERDGLTRDLAAQAQGRQRLALLTDQRQKQQTENEKALGQERQRLAELARAADNLKDLMTKLEQSLPRGGRGSGKAAEGRQDFAALKDPGRLEPAIAFATAKGRLPLPVNGVRIKEFGAPDGIGGTEKGLTVATRPGAQITAPCDGTVVYSGPFRNYGHLLILNAGSGYHVLLAGMDRISVDLGQFVVTGEPVAVMGGGGGQVPAALAASSGQPVLYVEFRKDGTPVDPSPWWATSEGEKVRG
ncbi:MAG TPA: peptidoglycan DD-metalloendopeptidase family protein [Xanthobacteraceae bacterium]